MCSTGPSSRDSFPVRELRFADCDQLSDLVSGGDVEFIQLGAGASKGSMMRIDLEGFFLLLADVPNRSACHAASKKGLRVVQVPLRWSRSLYWNGKALDRPGVMIWGDSCEFCRVGDDLSVLTVAIDESMLRKQIEVWGPSSHSRWDRFNGQMLADTPAAHRFIETVKWVIELATHAPERLGFPEVRTQLREQVLLALFEAAEAPGDHVLLGNPTTQKRTRIVRRMTDYLLAHPHREMELSDLCQLTGSSARSIAHACQTVLRTSPMRYLKQLRLNRARILLRKGSREVTSVSECAHFAGFSHLGRFSADYRRTFGESPSQTLDRLM